MYSVAPALLQKQLSSISSAKVYVFKLDRTLIPNTLAFSKRKKCGINSGGNNTAQSQIRIVSSTGGISSSVNLFCFLGLIRHQLNVENQIIDIVYLEDRMCDLKSFKNEVFIVAISRY